VAPASRAGGATLPPAAVARTWRDRDEAGIGAQREDLAEQIAQAGLVADAEARDGGVVGHLVGRVITRNATPSRQRRSIARDERSPIAYA
jgi:hypothetical protein